MPTPTVLSTRILPWCCSMISRHIDEADARAAFAAGVGAVLRGVEAVEDSRQLFGRNAAAGVANREVDGAGRRVGRDANHDATAAGHRLPGVGQQVEQHLLNLVAADAAPAATGSNCSSTCTRYFRISRSKSTSDSSISLATSVGDAVGAAVAGHAQDAVGDLLGPLRGGEDFGEALCRAWLRLCGAGRAWRS